MESLPRENPGLRDRTVSGSVRPVDADGGGTRRPPEVSREAVTEILERVRLGTLNGVWKLGPGAVLDYVAKSRELRLLRWTPDAENDGLASELVATFEAR